MYVVKEFENSLGFTVGRIMDFFLATFTKKRRKKEKIKRKENKRNLS